MVFSRLLNTALLVRLAAAWAVWLVFQTAESQAAPIYQYVFDQPNYSVAPGGTVNVKVSLRETLGPGDTSLLGTEGLFGSGVRVRFDVPPLPIQRAQVTSTSNININPLFDGFVFKDLAPASSAGMISTIGLVSPAVAAVGGPNVFETFFGTFTFTAGALPGEVTHLLATDFGGTSDVVTNNTLTVLDAQIANGAATITVQGTANLPEPGGLAMAVLGLCAGLGFLCLPSTARKRSLPATKKD